MPLIVALQVRNPTIDPAGTVTANVNDVPDNVPDSEPAKVMIPCSVDAVTGPDTDPPDCETVHVILPGSVESEADPEYVPLSVTDGVVGDVGVGPLEPPHAAQNVASATPRTSRADQLAERRTNWEADV